MVYIFIAKKNNKHDILNDNSRTFAMLETLIVGTILMVTIFKFRIKIKYRTIIIKNCILNSKRDIIGYVHINNVSMSKPIELPLTNTVKEFFASSEGKNLIRSSVGNNITITDDDIKLCLRNYLDTIDGKLLIKNIMLNSRDFENIMKKFCETGQFRDYILHLTQSQSYFEEFCKQSYMVLTIANKVNEIAPKDVEREIRHQLCNIILERFNFILSSELSKLLPSMVKGYCKEYCDDKVPAIARSTAETNVVSTVNSIVPSMVTSGVNHGIQQQFPIYLQNHSGVQNMLASHINQLNNTLHNTAVEEIAKITRDDKNNELVIEHLHETSRRCNDEISKIQIVVNSQIQKNETMFNDQLQSNANYVFGQIETFKTGFNDSLNKMQTNLNSNVLCLQKDISSLKEENYKLKQLLKGIIGISVVCIGTLCYAFATKESNAPTFKIT